MCVWILLLTLYEGRMWPEVLSVCQEIIGTECFMTRLIHVFEMYKFGFIWYNLVVRGHFRVSVDNRFVCGDLQLHSFFSLTSLAV